MLTVFLLSVLVNYTETTETIRRHEAMQSTLNKSIILPVLLALLSSCTSLIPKPHEMASPDRIFIHENPRSGDYAVYGERSSGTGMIHRYEVHEVNGDEITIRYRMKYNDARYSDMAPKEWYYRQIDRDGNVISAWAINDDGDRFPTPVASHGGPGSLEHLTPIHIQASRPVSVKAGVFRPDAINNYILRTDAGLASVNSTVLEYYSDSVPFRVIKREMLHTADVGGLLKTAEYLQTAGEFYLTNDYMKIYSQVTKNDIDYQNTIELLEYGFNE